MVYHRLSQLNIFYILIKKTLYSPYLGYTPAIKDSNRISTIDICTICSGNSMITGISIFKKTRGVPESLFANETFSTSNCGSSDFRQDLHARLPSWQRGLGTSLPAAVPSPGWMRAVLGRWGIWKFLDAPILRWDFSEPKYTKMEGAPVLERIVGLGSCWKPCEKERAPFSMIPVPRRGNKLPKPSDVLTSWTLWPPPSHLKHCLCRFQMLNQRHVV